MTTLTGSGGISERTLRRLVRWGALALAVLLVTFGVVYVLGQRVDSGPTLAERQVSSAEDAVRAAPQNVQNRLLLASAYQKAGRLDDAAAQLQEVLKAVPTNNTALLAL
ncbi:MAG TPA: tetratricopeptide repeat protein, partial [Propionibacteriaceae bacterium]|nr:tetratricopeptide repeat protein [Propionibacteriaceae bacterium]